MLKNKKWVRIVDHRSNYQLSSSSLMLLETWRVFQDYRLINFKQNKSELKINSFIKHQILSREYLLFVCREIL